MDEQTMLSLLKELDQQEILSRYEKASQEEKDQFIKHFNYIDETCPGGVKDYIKRAKVLLENSKNNVNPFGDYTPSIPTGFNINVGDSQFLELDKIGMEQIKDTVFVMVAGGLGERLGYPSIKIGIQTDLITLRPFIQVYIDIIKAYEDRVHKANSDLDKNWFIPLCIMTSGDTHDKTVQLLAENNNFGLKPKQIVLVKQEKCPAILDNECHLSLKKDILEIETKPHGHGDIHLLLYQKGLVNNWVSDGKKYMVLFQDTNALIFNSIPSAIGTSVKLGLAINTICIPRKPGEAVGAICKLTKSDGTSITNNVEYNQLEALLKEKYNPQGDVPNKDGISDFPGNTNVLIFQLDIYLKALDKTKGLIPEFVNPKYADESKTKFKSPTRLECLMQDLPKLLTDGEKVGFTSYPRWFCFSTCKNNLKDACAKLKKNLGPEAAFSVEQDIFILNAKMIESFGKLEVVQDEAPVQVEVEGCVFKFGPRIIIYPSFAASIYELKEKMEKMKGKIRMTINSTLILKNDITIEEGVDLDGNLTIDKDEKELVKCHNKKRWEYYPLKPDQGKIYEKIRGYGILLNDNGNE